ncbi:MAG: hypothetical protein ACOYBV_03990 [Candidatus Avilachnospira sp.]|jgi:hypothetical protein
MKNYDDIINHRYRGVVRHAHMPVDERAAQFSPFAALTGYSEVIKEKERLTERAPELSEEEKNRLDMKVMKLIGEGGYKKEVTVSFFEEDRLKEGGEYRRVRGKIKSIDNTERKLRLWDGSMIDMDSITDIELS